MEHQLSSIKPASHVQPVAAVQLAAVFKMAAISPNFCSREMKPLSWTLVGQNI
jgi:hypothetical protein